MVSLPEKEYILLISGSKLQSLVGSSYVYILSFANKNSAEIFEVSTYAVS